MKSFVLMISFFTRIPLPKIDYSEARFARGIRFVPLIGLLMGGVLYSVAMLCAGFDSDVAAIVLLATYILLTGALHIDGMADTCDGVFSGRDRDRMLEIMRDSRTGVYGVISIALLMLFYAVLFGHISYEALLIMPVAGKSAPLISGYMADYARPSGLGKVFAENCGRLELAAAIAVPAAAAALLDPWLLPGVAAALVASAAATAGLKRSIGGITGDTMGFVCEFSQLVFLLTVYVTGVLL